MSEEKRNNALLAEMSVLRTKLAKVTRYLGVATKELEPGENEAQTSTEEEYGAALAALGVAYKRCERSAAANGQRFRSIGENDVGAMPERRLFDRRQTDRRSGGGS